MFVACRLEKSHYYTTGIILIYPFYKIIPVIPVNKRHDLPEHTTSINNADTYIPLNKSILEQRGNSALVFPTHRSSYRITTIVSYELAYSSFKRKRNQPTRTNT